MDKAKPVPLAGEPQALPGTGANKTSGKNPTGTGRPAPTEVLGFEGFADGRCGSGANRMMQGNSTIGPIVKRGGGAGVS